MKMWKAYGKKLMDTATNTGVDAANTACKRVVCKTAEAAGDLIGNEIADKTTSVCKKKKRLYIPPEKRQSIIDDLRFF